MIATVLAQDGDQPAALAAKWRQLVDLLGQRRERDSEDSESAFAWLSDHRDALPARLRQEAARSLVGRRVSPRLIAFFSDDQASVAAPLIGGARLDPDEWLDILPRLSPTGRSLLRHRRDLSPEVEHALASFGASDFALGTGAPQPDAELRSVVAEAEASLVRASPGGARSETQIRDLVSRIENFRRLREAGARPPRAEIPQAESFQWEAGPDGVVTWVEGAPRGPLIGQTIAVIAELGQYGVDGQAAGAFEKRAPFRDARFSVAGSGPGSGDWRISGVPFFDPAQGSFLGYRGSARRPRVDEVARAPVMAEPAGLFGTGFPADSLRQLIHELRTPLNAIVGFAELIDGQYMGPAAAGYRGRAAEIMDQAGRLLSAVDDLDTAARIETSRLSLDESAIDAVALLCRLHDAYERVAQQRNSRISIEIERDLPPARVELGAAERMFARMLAGTIGLAEEGETISATMNMGQIGGHRMLCLSIDRPRSLAGLDERALLDPGYSPDGDWPGAPALGLGFALRLVRNLAEAVGGALVIDPDRIALYLPALAETPEAAGQGGGA